MSIVVVAPTCVRYTFKHTLTGNHKCDNVVAVSVEPTVGTDRSSAIGDFNAQINGMWQNNMLGAMNVGTTFNGTSWVDLHTATGAVGFIGPKAGAPVNGADNNTPCSPQVAALIHLNSAAQRGSRQGRLYFAPLSENYVDGAGAISAGSSTLIKNKVEAFRSAIDAYVSLYVESAAWRTIHVHKPNRLDPSTWTWSSSTIDTVSVDPQCATQRRRNRK